MSGASSARYAVPLRCYLHPNARAVTSCAVCHRPICSDCLVVVRGRRLCTHHAEAELEGGEIKETPGGRGVPLSVAAVLSVTNGSLAALGGFLLIIIGLLQPTTSSDILKSSFEPFLKNFADVLLFPAGEALVAGFIVFMLGCIDVATAAFIWRRSKVGAVVSVFASITGVIMTGIYLELLALAGPYALAWIALGFVKIGSVVLGWKRLL